jgi:hypothetical protein
VISRKFLRRDTVGANPDLWDAIMEVKDSHKTEKTMRKHLKDKLEFTSRYVTTPANDNTKILEQKKKEFETKR